MTDRDLGYSDSECTLYLVPDEILEHFTATAAHELGHVMGGSASPTRTP